MYILDLLCGLVVRVLGYRSGGPGSIPGTTRFSGKKKKRKTSSGSGTGYTRPREYNWGATWWKSSGSCLENREYGRRDPSRWPCGTLYPQKLVITSPRSGGRSVGIVRSRTQTRDFFFVHVQLTELYFVETTQVAPFYSLSLYECVPIFAVLLLYNGLLSAE
jgi:hypothetical protein